MIKRFPFLTLLVAFALLACQAEQQGSTQVVAEDDPQLRLSNGVLFYAERPFSGVVASNYANGQAKAKTEYHRGLQHGASWMWYEDGSLLWQREYRNGKKHGEHKGWWPNGAKKFVYHFINGEHEGEASEWYVNGRLAQRNHYERGQELGLQQAWRENGKLYANYVAKNGKRYGLINSRLCYTVKDGEAQND
jgi:antitoxin component YwqK of YwqJK toxin-antitoxin module